MMKHYFLILVFAICSVAKAQVKQPVMNYSLSFPKPQEHLYHVKLESSGWTSDTVNLKMPKWMPGYYQIMNYWENVANFSAKDAKGKTLTFKKTNDNTWSIAGTKSKSFVVEYDIQTKRQFVATSYVDSAHAYVVTSNTFLYPEGKISLPVTVNVDQVKGWTKIATGLTPVLGKASQYSAVDFDILYDCPILIADLEEFPSFEVDGKLHRFLAYKPGTFDKKGFMEKLKNVVTAGAAIIGDVPYDQYTFIGIGPGRGGIEHLNNTTVSFDGKGLDTPDGANRMLNFLAHEYFHHYNVKRIRPLELGPFDYDHGSRTNLLWISEGLTVYYEYLMVKRAGVCDEKTFLEDFEHNITAFENGSGKSFQSLAQASYNTWKDGPFGTTGEEPGKSISYYDKGPVVGLLLDFAIRQATKNKKSLDDVMRTLYWEYYKKQHRGFTDAEFQFACESTAGIYLGRFFEYVQTARDLDYTTYLGYAGLTLESSENPADKTKKVYKLVPVESPDAQQREILNSWMGKKY